MKTIEKRELSDLYLRQGLSMTEIAEKFEVTKEYVNSLLIQYDLLLPNNTEWTEEEIQYVADLCNQGVTLKDIGRELNRSWFAVQRVVSTRKLREDYVKNAWHKNRFRSVKRMYFEEHKTVAEIAKLYHAVEEEMYDYMDKHHFFETPEKEKPKKPDLNKRNMYALEQSFRVCAECGKDFPTLNPNDWVYAGCNSHGKLLFFCSWSCIQKYREKKPLKKRKKDRYEAD